MLSSWKDSVQAYIDAWRENGKPRETGTLLFDTWDIYRAVLTTEAGSAERDGKAVQFLFMWFIVWRCRWLDCIVSNDRMIDE
jgi:hypothetical protein